jgi:glycine betaine/proline transport system substrate-binding protein
MYRLPLGNWAEHVVSWLQSNVDPLFSAITTVITDMYNGVDWVLEKPEPLLLAGIFAVIALWLRGPLAGVLAFVGLGIIDSLQLWQPAMQTMSQVLVASVITLVFAVPLGIWAARTKTGNAIMRPILDLMQTMPAFVYLIPGILFFGTGVVPAAIATIVFSMPPGVRMTDLGIRQVDADLVEAADAFGTTPRKTLFRVQLPLALPTIMAGVNQVIMLSLSMVVISAMVGAPGLGQSIYTAISSVNVGQGVEGGVAVVILAMYLDRITGSLGERVSPLGRRALAKANSFRGRAVLHYRPAGAFALVGVVVLALIAGGLNYSQNSGNSGSSVAAGNVGKGQAINIGYINWDEDVATTALWSEVLKERGFKPQAQQMDVGALFTSVATGSNDFMTDAWLPTTHASYWAKYKSKLSDLGTWYPKTSLEVAVPSYVKDVHSLSDLAAHSSEFGGKITGIEPGSGEMGLMKSKVMPAYGLNGKMQLQASSTATMLAELDREYKAKKPIATTLWTPHWAYAKYKLTKLTDPKGAFGSGDGIHTIATNTFAKKSPVVADWLKKFHMSESQLSSLENLVHGSGQSATGQQAAAKKWLAQNPGLLNKIAPIPGGGSAPAGSAGGGKTVNLGYFPWDEDIATSYLWQNVLTRRGYKVKLQQLDPGAMYTAMSEGQIDFNTDAWLPTTHAQYWARYKKDLVNLGSWYGQTSLEISVPSYVKDVHSMSDLAKHSSEFGGKIIGIEPGAGEMGLLKSKVLPAYGLDKNFTLTQGSTSSMLAELQRDYAQKKPVAVVLWSPHWAYAKYKMTKLTDPKKAWGPADSIDTVAYKGLPKKFPQIADWLKKFRLSETQLSTLENDIQGAGQGHEAQGVSKWLSANPGIENQMAPNS